MVKNSKIGNDKGNGCFIDVTFEQFEHKIAPGI